MQDRIEKLEKAIDEIQLRNARVEAEKAWEVSMFRIASIAIITYGVAATILLSIGVEEFLLNAFVPTAGYLLSVQSVPLLKKWWIKRYGIGKKKIEMDR